MDEGDYVLVKESVVSYADLEEAVGVEQDCLVEDDVEEIDVGELVEERETVLLGEKGLEVYLLFVGVMLTIENCEILIVVLFITEVYELYKRSLFYVYSYLTYVLFEVLLIYVKESMNF